MKTIEVVFDGKAFVPKEPVGLPPGTRLTITLPIRDEGEAPLPWATVEDAIGYSRGRPGYHLFLDPDGTKAEDRP